MSMERIVRPAILEVFSKSCTDFQLVIGCHGDVARVEEPMNVRAKQQTIGGFMRAFGSERFDVRSFERRQRVLARHGASSIVHVGHNHSESPLSESRSHECRIAVTRHSLTGDAREGLLSGHHTYSVLTLVP